MRTFHLSEQHGEVEGRRCLDNGGCTVLVMHVGFRNGPYLLLTSFYSWYVVQQSIQYGLFLSVYFLNAFYHQKNGITFTDYNVPQEYLIHTYIRDKVRWICIMYACILATYVYYSYIIAGGRTCHPLQLYEDIRHQHQQVNLSQTSWVLDYKDYTFTREN